MKIFPIIVKRVVSSVVNFLYRETLVRAARAIWALRLPETRAQAERALWALVMPESYPRGDLFLSPGSNSFRMPEANARRTDRAFFTITIPAHGRSGSPDNDDWGDAWTDETVGQTGTNHGNEVINITSQVSAVTEKRAFVKINLTRFTNLVAYPGGVHTLSIRLTNQAQVAPLNITLNMQGQAGNPFTESTLTWSNQPATPTAITRSIAVGATDLSALKTVTLTDAELNQLLGKWVLIVFTAPLLNTDVNIHPREQPTNGMTLAFGAQVA